MDACSRLRWPLDRDEALRCGPRIAAATGGVRRRLPVTGVAFDSRDVRPGDLFFALKGEATDGHRFLDQAFAQRRRGRGRRQAVDAPARPGRGHHRARSTRSARGARARARRKIIGVTGSVGKTGTKEALFAALDRVAPGRARTARSRATTTMSACRSASRGCRATRASACSRWA